MKKIILILSGISLVLMGTIFALYENYYASSEEVVDIFKDNEKENIEEQPELLEDTKDKVIVDIKGMVTTPGVYEVLSSSRVNDVILLAGGLLENADTSLINLAKVVSDEMTIIIYSKEEVLEKVKDDICVCDCPLISNDACIDTNVSSDSENSLTSIININTASYGELISIPGIGDTKANDIIKYREENGKFNTIEDIMNVEGIGEALFEKIKDYITV